MAWHKVFQVKLLPLDILILKANAKKYNFHDPEVIDASSFIAG